MTNMAPGKSRALLLSPIVPDPYGVGLARRAWRWVAELTADHALDIFVVSTYPQSPPMRLLPGRIQLVQQSTAPQHSRNLTEWIDPDATICEAILRFDGPIPDRIVVFRLYLHDVAALLPPTWRQRLELDCDDWEAATRLSLARLALRHRRIGLAARRLWEAVRYARIERQTLSTYKTVYVSASEDIARLRRLTGYAAFKVCPNLIAPEAGLQPRPPAPGNTTLLFVGTLAYPPNEDAVIWFGKAILPLLRRRIPQVHLVVAGRAEKRLQDFMAQRSITYIHAPAELRQIYADAAGVVAPVRGGGGTKLKVLEAWLHARPLIVTPHAARGLDARPGLHFLVADTARDFALACAQLLTDPDLANRLAQAGHALARSRYLINAPDLIDEENDRVS
jgi:polysaccharide biosynthesis protein PslH